MLNWNFQRGRGSISSVVEVWIIYGTTVNSLLLDTSVKRTPGVGPVAAILQSFYCIV